MTFAILTMQEVESRISPKQKQRLASTCRGRVKGRCKGRERHERKFFSLYAMAHGDDRGVVARRRLNDQREVLSGTDKIELGGYLYQNKSIRTLY